MVDTSMDACANSSPLRPFEPWKYNDNYGTTDEMIARLDEICSRIGRLNKSDGSACSDTEEVEPEVRGSVDKEAPNIVNTMDSSAKGDRPEVINTASNVTSTPKFLEDIHRDCAYVAKVLDSIQLRKPGVAKPALNIPNTVEIASSQGRCEVVGGGGRISNMKQVKLVEPRYRLPTVSSVLKQRPKVPYKPHGLEVSVGCLDDLRRSGQLGKVNGADGRKTDKNGSLVVVGTFPDSSKENLFGESGAARKVRSREALRPWASSMPIDDGCKLPFSFSLTKHWKT